MLRETRRGVVIDRNTEDMFVCGDRQPEVVKYFGELNIHLQGVPGYANSKAVVVPVGSSIGAWTLRKTPGIRDLDWALVYDSSSLQNPSDLRTNISYVGEQWLLNNNFIPCASTNPRTHYFDIAHVQSYAAKLPKALKEFRRLLLKTNYSTEVVLSEESYKTIMSIILPYSNDIQYATKAMNDTLFEMYEAKAFIFMSQIWHTLLPYFVGRAKAVHLCELEDEVKPRYYAAARKLNLMRIKSHRDGLVPVSSDTIAALQLLIDFRKRLQSRLKNPVT